MHNSSRSVINKTTKNRKSCMRHLNHTREGPGSSVPPPGPGAVCWRYPPFPWPSPSPPLTDIAPSLEVAWTLQLQTRPITEPCPCGAPYRPHCAHRDRLFRQRLETIPPEAKPLNNCRWISFCCDHNAGLSRVRVAPTVRTREPAPLGLRRRPPLLSVTRRRG